MAGQLTIELNGVHFYAEHGVLDEEAKLGNEFIVTVKLQIDTASEVITSIGETINYVEVFEIVRSQMQQRRSLLETVAMEIAQELHNKYSLLRKAIITIIKTNPPIENFSGNVGITYDVEY